MADYWGAAGDLVGGIAGFFGGMEAASAYKKEAALYGQAAQYSLLETGIKEVAANRQVYQVLGQARADIGASGLADSGSAAAVMRSSAQQGGLTKALIGLQGKIDYTGYEAQQAAAIGQAQSAESSGFGSLFGGILGAAGAIFSDDSLKSDVQLISRRDDGLGLYSFTYLGEPGRRFYGVLASEVEEIEPDAILYDAAGTRRVDYDRINMPFGVMETV